MLMVIFISQIISRFTGFPLKKDTRLTTQTQNKIIW